MASKYIKSVQHHYAHVNHDHNEVSPGACQNGCHQKDKSYQTLVRRKENPNVSGNVNWGSHYRV